MEMVTSDIHSVYVCVCMHTCVCLYIMCINAHMESGGVTPQEPHIYFLRQGLSLA